MPSETPIGAILCGGAARRLGGADKAAIEIDGATLASTAVALLRPYCDEFIALTGNRGSFPVDGIPIVRDRLPGRGPLSGLDAAFHSRPGRTIFLLAVDLCTVPGDVASRLIDALRDRPGAAAIARTPSSSRSDMIKASVECTTVLPARSNLCLASSR